MKADPCGNPDNPFNWWKLNEELDGYRDISPRERFRYEKKHFGVGEHSLTRKQRLRKLRLVNRHFDEFW